MYCLECGALLRFSFLDDMTGHPVYQCGTVGVETQRAIGRDTALVYTLDHQDRFFTRIFGTGPLVRVMPVRLSKEASEQVLKSKGYPFERDEHHKKIVPACWTTTRNISNRRAA